MKPISQPTVEPVTDEQWTHAVQQCVDKFIKNAADDLNAEERTQLAGGFTQFHIQCQMRETLAAQSKQLQLFTRAILGAMGESNEH